MKMGSVKPEDVFALQNLESQAADDVSMRPQLYLRRLATGFPGFIS